MFRKVIWLLVGMLILGAVLYIYPKYSLYAQSRILSSNSEIKEFYIKLPTQLDELADQLIEAGIIVDKDAFVKVGNYKQISELNIATGKYLIPAVPHSLEFMREGQSLSVDGVKISLVKGGNIDQIRIEPAN